MSTEEAKTVAGPAPSLSFEGTQSQAIAEDNKGMSRMLLENERVNEVEKNGEGFGVLCKDVESVGFPDNIGDLGTENKNAGNARDGESECINDGISGVLCKDAGNGAVPDDLGLLGTKNEITRNIMDGESKFVGDEKRGTADEVVDVEDGISVGSAAEGVDGVLCKDDGNEGVSVTFGTESVNGEVFKDDDGKCISGAKEATVSVGLYLSDNNLEKIDRKGISLVVDLSDYECLAKCDADAVVNASSRKRKKSRYLSHPYV